MTIPLAKIKCDLTASKTNTQKVTTIRRKQPCYQGRPFNLRILTREVFAKHKVQINITTHFVSSTFTEAYPLATTRSYAAF